MSIADELSKIIATKADIAAAIKEKGVTVRAGTPFFYWCVYIPMINETEYNGYTWYSYDSSKTELENELAELQNTKDNLRKVITACGVYVDESLPFSEYGNKIREIQKVTPSYGYSGTLYYMENGVQNSLNLSSSSDLAPLAKSTPPASVTIQGKVIPVENIVGYAAGTDTYSGLNKLDYLFYKYPNFKFLKNSNNLRNAGSMFIAYCENFNSPVFFNGSNNNSYTDNAFYHCSNFNSPFILTSPFMQNNTPCSLLAYATSFNQPLVFPVGQTKIRQSTLTGCTSFNSPVVLPDTVTSIEFGFLSGCTAFNQPIKLPANLATIGSSFLSDCSSFAQPLTLPDSLQTIDGSFLYNAANFVGPLDVGNATPPTDTNALASSVPTSLMYRRGIAITGANAQAWIDALPNSDGTSRYRKLVLVKEGDPDYEEWKNFKMPYNISVLKNALDADEAEGKYPVGTEFASTYQGSSSPWTVMQYGTAETPSGETVDGVYLVRLIAQPAHIWNSTTPVDYATSEVNAFLNNEYFNACDANSKKYITEIKIPYYNSSTKAAYANAKCWLLSSMEVLGAQYSNDGYAFDLWKQRLGRDTPTGIFTRNSGRQLYNLSTAVNWWLRSMESTTKPLYVDTGGGLYNNKAPTDENVYLVVACFMAKGSGADLPDSIDISKPLDEDTLSDIKKVVAAGKAQDYFKLGDELLVNYSSYVMPFEIVGFEDVETDNGVKPALNLLAKYTSENTTAWGADADVKYSTSTLRNYCTGTYQGKLDTNFIDCLASTKVQTYDGSTDVVYDKLFAPSMAEIGFPTNDTQDAVEGPAFTAYINADSARRIKQAIDNTSSATTYWTRSSSVGSQGYFRYINASGGSGLYAYSATRRVVTACNLVGD